MGPPTALPWDSSMVRLPLPEAVGFNGVAMARPRAFAGLHGTAKNGTFMILPMGLPYDGPWGHGKPVAVP